MRQTCARRPFSSGEGNQKKFSPPQVSPRSQPARACLARLIWASHARNVSRPRQSLALSSPGKLWADSGREHPDRLVSPGFRRKAAVCTISRPFVRSLIVLTIFDFFDDFLTAPTHMVPGPREEVRLEVRRGAPRCAWRCAQVRRRCAQVRRVRREVRLEVRPGAPRCAGPAGARAGGLVISRAAHAAKRCVWCSVGTKVSEIHRAAHFSWDFVGSLAGVSFSAKSSVSGVRLHENGGGPSWKSRRWRG